VTVDRTMSPLNVSWLSDAAQKLQAIVGGELWQEIVKALGGSTIYVPLESNYYVARNRQIRFFSSNHTLRETSRRFCLSERQVKRILGG